jgi:hypothetical protein
MGSSKATEKCLAKYSVVYLFLLCLWNMHACYKRAEYEFKPSSYIWV